MEYACDRFQSRLLRPRLYGKVQILANCYWGTWLDSLADQTCENRTGSPRLRTGRMGRIWVLSKLPSDQRLGFLSVRSRSRRPLKSRWRVQDVLYAKAHRKARARLAPFFYSFFYCRFIVTFHTHAPLMANLCRVMCGDPQKASRSSVACPSAGLQPARHLGRRTSHPWPC